MKKILIYTILFAAGIFQSCNAWLDVKPSDRISEPDVYSSKEGFYMALNGVYIELNSSSLYGKNLTYDFVDLLANYYAVHYENADAYKMVREYYYQGVQTKKTIQDIWTKAYNTIANLNIIIQKCETNRSVLPDDDYGIVKGEALALRAMLHLDMLRLFGPVPTDKIGSSIPYYTEFVFSRPPYEKVDGAVSKVLSDLDKAAELLKPYDSVIENGFNNVSANNFKNYRQLRLNYYAVKALTARAALYGGLNDVAFAAAKEVIEVQPKFFPLSTIEEVTLGDNPDRIFSKEVIFGSQIANRGTIFRSVFEATSKISTSYFMNSKNCSDFFNSELNDYRYKSWFSTAMTIDNTEYRIFSKYQDGKDLDRLSAQILPLIRIGEVILIAAECDPDPNKEYGVSLLNDFRTKRGLSQPSPPVTKYNLQQQIGYQYQREFIGEGQLFFLFKRENRKNIKAAHDRYNDIEMTAMKYRLPKPDDESKYD